MEGIEVQNVSGSGRRKQIVVGLIVAFAVAALTVGLVVGLTHTTKNTSSSSSQQAQVDTLGPQQSDKENTNFSSGHNFTFINQCEQNVWVGALGNPGDIQPNNGGWLLTPGEISYVMIPKGWQGRFWGRTGCSEEGWCQTGDCGGKIECAGAGGNPPATLAEFTLDDWTGTDWYDVSLVDGYNLPLQIAALSGFKLDTGNQYDCGVGGCNQDLNLICPLELQVLNSSGQVVACMSACEKFGADQYCCTGAYNTPGTCPPTGYSEIFKTACPRAYSYAYDDPTSDFTCHNDPETSYEITFCATTPTTGFTTGQGAGTYTNAIGGSTGAAPGPCGAGLTVCNPSYQDPDIIQCCSPSQTCQNDTAGFGVCCDGGMTHCLNGGWSACCTGACYSWGC